MLSAQSIELQAPIPQRLQAQVSRDRLRPKPHRRTNPWTFGFERRVLREDHGERRDNRQADVPARPRRSTARLLSIYGLPMMCRWAERVPAHMIYAPVSL
jgi:hypothetical protein